MPLHRISRTSALAGVLSVAVMAAAATAQTQTAREDPGQGPPRGPAVIATPIAEGLAVPVMLTDPGDGSGRRFVVDQPGQIRIIDDQEQLLQEPFLDVSDRLVELDPNYDERGLLGLAFHPEFAENGRFFVYYSAPAREQAPNGWDHTSHLAEFRVDADDPNRADPQSERVIMRIDQPYGNHNGGHITFGRDGMLYVPLGDGGNGNDQDREGDDIRPRPERGNAQTRSTLLGSVLRLDVDGERPYEVPDDNPFVGEQNSRGEIWAYGLRNPFGLSVDRETGDMYASDAGQALFEEVNRLEAGGNFGWNIKEGTSCFNPADATSPLPECPDEGPYGRPLIDPVVEYQRGPETGSVVIPGVRYRGEAIPQLRDQVVFGDYSRIRYRPDGVIYTAAEEDERPWDMEQVTIENALDGQADGELNRFLLSISQDADGELYALTSDAGGPAGETGAVLALTAPEEATTAAADEDDDGLDWWVWVIVAAILVLLLGGAVVAIMRARGGPDGAMGER